MRLSLLLTTTAIGATSAVAISTTVPPIDYKAMLPERHTSAAATCALISDALPWGSAAWETELSNAGIQYDGLGSEAFGRDLSDYEFVIIANDQPQSFYDAYSRNRQSFEGYVEGGGVVVFGACDLGWGGGEWDLLPGGVIGRLSNYEDQNDVVDVESRIVEGVANPFNGNRASHDDFVLNGAQVHVQTESSLAGGPTTISYDLGHGHVVATGVTVEWGHQNNLDYSAMVSNLIDYAVSVETSGSALDIYLSGLAAEIQRGEVYSFWADVVNTGDEVEYFDAAWLRVTGPYDRDISLLEGRMVPVQPRGSVGVEVRQQVARVAPLGTYTVTVEILLEGESSDDASFAVDVVD